MKKEPETVGCIDRPTANRRTVGTRSIMWEYTRHNTVGTKSVCTCSEHNVPRVKIDLVYDVSHACPIIYITKYCLTRFLTRTRYLNSMFLVIVTEEEIDVVTFEKPCRQSATATHHSAQQQHPAPVPSRIPTELDTDAKVVRRPRGRPSNASRKRQAQSPHPQQQEQPPAKRARTRKQRSKAKAPNTRINSSDDEADEIDKRSLHNNMERQRRIGLRNLFEALRQEVPSIAMKDKAPKVTILRQATMYCVKQFEESEEAEQEVAELKRRQEKLRAKLAQLRRSHTASRKFNRVH